MFSICLPTDFMTFILKNPRNSMTLAKRSNVQTKPTHNGGLLSHLRISNPRPAARGLHVGNFCKEDKVTCTLSYNTLYISYKNPRKAPQHGSIIYGCTSDMQELQSSISHC